MKSYFLSPISSPSDAVTALSEVLPWQIGFETVPGVTGSWLLRDSQHDAVAFFLLVQRDGTTYLRTIQADVSGRHYDEDDAVLAVLRKLQTRLGGEITDDDWKLVHS